MLHTIVTRLWSVNLTTQMATPQFYGTADLEKANSLRLEQEAILVILDKQDPIQYPTH